MTDEIDPRQKISDAVRELFLAWRPTHPLDDMDAFFDQVLSPCLDEVVKGL